ncbi:MAG: ROK family protein [Chloroflexales bacterium]|nr:ROK family protein [Chloroflexales bacterium]
MTDVQVLINEGLEQARWGLLGSQGHVLGVDLGGYGLRAVLVDLHERTLTSAHAEPAGGDPQQVVEQTIELCRGLLRDQAVEDGRLVRVGVGFGGPVDSRNGTVLLSPRSSGWEHFPLQAQFERAFDAATLVDNDANLIALAEATFGVGRNVDHLFYLHLSSGVGGGAVLDGRLYHGATTTAGEIGHAMVGYGWDGIGQPATLEQLVSVPGMLARAGDLGARTDNLNDLFGQDVVGQQVVRETVNILAMQLAQLVVLLDPQMVVLGGIVARIGGEPFVDAVRDQMVRYIQPQFARSVQVVASALGPDSIAVGGVALALESLRD